MNIDDAKRQLEKITGMKVIKGVKFKEHFIFEVKTPNKLSTPFYAINDEGKISSFTPIDYLDEFFDAWDHAKVWIPQKYPEIID